MSRIDKKVAFVAAATLLASTLEYLIPKPLPFLRLGLANLPLLIVLDVFNWQAYFALLLLKAIGQGFVSGTLFSYLFFISLAGTLSSGLVMKGIKSLFRGKVSLVGCSLAGAFASNLAQLQVSAWIVYGATIWVAAPLMLSIGMITSLVLGLFAEIYLQKGKIPALLRDDTFEFGVPLVHNLKHNLGVSITSFLAILSILFIDNLLILGIATILMYMLQLIAHRKIRIIPPIMLMLSMTMLSLFEPNGKVLYTLGSVALTQGALKLAITKALRLICLLSASQCLSASNPKLKGKFGSYIPLTLAYFSLLSSSFKQTSGSLFSRVDQALERTAAAEQSESNSMVQKRAINTTLFVCVGLLVVGLGILSKTVLPIS